jgi:transposase
MTISTTGLEPNKPFTRTMKAPSTTKVDLIVQMLKSGHSGEYIASTLDVSTGTVSNICLKYCPDIEKSSGGCPPTLSSANIHYATYPIERGKVDNTAHVTGTLQNITNQHLSSQTVWRTLKQVGLKQ